MVKLADIEKRLMVGTICATLFGVLLLLVTLCTDHWVYVGIPGGIYRNDTKTYRLAHYSGLWRICFHEIDNSTGSTEDRSYCRALKFYPSKENIAKDPEVDVSILNFSRAETAFAVISLVFALISHVFAFYTFFEIRYMIKRLAACLYLMTVMCVFITAEVFMKSVEYEMSHLPERLPASSVFYYGYSFGLIWVVFVIYLVAVVVFFVLGRKRKREKAHSVKEAQENEPVHLGRI